jgi:glycosyltransferase involved in cell wall biosynthesis
LRVVLTALHFIDYTVHLANAMAKLADTTLVIARRKAEHILGAIDPAVTRHEVDLPRVMSLGGYLWGRKLARDILAMKPDAVHMQEVNPWFDLQAPWIAKRTALVDTVHDVERHPGHRQAKRVPFIRRMARRAAHRIIVHGQALKRMMVDDEGAPESKVHVIPHGNFLHYLNWGDPSVREEDGTVLFFGRIWEYKGLEYLIRAEPAISQAIPNLRIIVGGQGEDFARYRAMMAHPERFEVHNEFVSRDLSADLFRRASVVVLPYAEASQSGVLAFAYTFGKPVVVTNVGSLPEVVDEGETGLVVPPKDTQALAEAVVAILKDPGQRHAMGRKAYEKATTDLSWDRIAEQTLNVYREAIDGRGR